MNSRKPILVCGDAMWDHYWSGEVTRISPEAPVPIVLVTSKEMRSGAAANVVANIAAMGEATFNVTCRTANKYRITGKHQQIVRADFDEAPSAKDISQMEFFFKERLPHCDIVVFSDYAKGTLRNIEQLIQLAKAAGKLILVDPKGYDYKRYAGADLVKPNLDEIRHMVGGWGSEEQLRAKVQLILGEAQVRSILLTRAADGMTLFNRAGINHFPSEAREVYDVTGAGDTAIAALAVGMNRGLGWIESVRLAVRASGIVVAKFGTAVCTKEELWPN